jgi:hypothetical protein
MLANLIGGKYKKGIEIKSKTKVKRALEFLNADFSKRSKYVKQNFKKLCQLKEI